MNSIGIVDAVLSMNLLLDQYQYLQYVGSRWRVWYLFSVLNSEKQFKPQQMRESFIVKTQNDLEGNKKILDRANCHISRRAVGDRFFSLMHNSIESQLRSALIGLQSVFACLLHRQRGKNTI